jgi:GT2 family glycosyltransferase
VASPLSTSSGPSAGASSASAPSASTSIVVPTHRRPDYLEVALASIAGQAQTAGVEVLVVGDGPDTGARELAERHGARYLELQQSSGLNAARNAAIDATDSELLVFIDDDVEAPPDWLGALLAGVESAPDCEVFGGPIRARLEGGGPSACGREPAPITTLDCGPQDRDVPFVWGANMAIRRRALHRVGRFDETITGGRGDEEEWEHRYIAQGGRVRYLAGAGLEHRRTPQDASVKALAKAAYGHGRAARRTDVRKGVPPTARTELRTLAGCGYHAICRRCAIGIVMGAHAAGRLREALRRTST